MITFAGGEIDLDTLNHENMHQWWGDNVSEAQLQPDLLQGGHGHARRVPVRRPHRRRPRRAARAPPAGHAAFQRSLVKQFNANYAQQRAVLDRRPVRPDAGRACSPGPRPTPGRARPTSRCARSSATRTSPGRCMRSSATTAAARITEPQLEAGFHRWLPNPQRGLQQRLDQFFTQWFDTAYPRGRRRQPAADHRSRAGRAGLLHAEAAPGERPWSSRTPASRTRGRRHRDRGGSAGERVMQGCHDEADDP